MSMCIRAWMSASIAVSILLLATSAIAEDEFGNKPSASQDCLCFRGSPLDHCKSFLITNLGIGFYTTQYRFDDYHGAAVSLDLGWMKNIGRKYAFGVASYQAIDGHTFRFGVSPHLRRWLGEKMSADLSLGALLYCNQGEFVNFGDPPRYDADGPGIVASFSLSVLDLFAATVHYERFKAIHRSQYIWIADVAPRQDYSQNLFSVGLAAQSYVGSGIVALVLLAGILDS